MSKIGCRTGKKDASAANLGKGLEVFFFFLILRCIILGNMQAPFGDTVLYIYYEKLVNLVCICAVKF